MTTNRPVSNMNPAADTDISQERTDLLKQDDALKTDPPVATDAPIASSLVDDLTPSPKDDQDPTRKTDDNTGEQAIATGTGSVGGAAIGATLGIVGGPGGAVVGGIVGGVIGGLAGKDISTPDHPERQTESSGLFGDEDNYWREHHHQRPYYSESQNIYTDLDYDRDYREVYRLGYASRTDYDRQVEFHEAETDLRTQWEQFKGESRLTWEQAKHAVRDAWDRATR